tara:strand:+ start:45912 stop:46886 length:975 start_codon:yes stop_codon:yes gene_type:complete
MKLFKVKNTHTFILTTLGLIILMGCSGREPITELRGKVKFETISITTKIAGRISQINVTEGQKVHKGDTLAIIDIPEISAKSMQADGAIRAAKAQLEMAYNGATSDQIEQIDSKLEAVKSQLRFAEESFARASNMYKDSLISAQQYDEATMKLAMAKAQVKATEAQRTEVIKGTRKELIEQVKGQLERALGAKAEVEVAAKEQSVIAPTNMSIETITLHKGELATPGYTIFNGYELNTLYFRFTVSESNVYNYEIGQEHIVVNPYTKEKIPVTLIAINQLARYADITSTSPTYKLSEAIYELKLVPLQRSEDSNMFINSTVLLK